MGKIKPGQSLPTLSGDTLSGKVISTDDYRGKPFILSFYRYAACPFCNLRMHHFIEKYKTEYQPAGIDAVAVFQSPVKSMKKYVSQHDAPFEIISDPKYQWYKTMGVKTSWLGFALGAANVKQVTEASQEGLLGINPEGTTMDGKELGTSSSSCGNCADLPLFSIVDLDCMQHDPTIEEFLQRILPHDPLDWDPGDDELPVSSMRMDTGDPWGPVELATTSVPPLDHLLPEYSGSGLRRHR